MAKTNANSKSYSNKASNKTANKTTSAVEHSNKTTGSKNCK